jgi:hypothetical protein
LGRREEAYGDGAATAGYGVGAVACFLGELGVLIDDDDQRGLLRGRVMHALSQDGFLACPLVKEPHGVTE